MGFFLRYSLAAILFLYSGDNVMDFLLVFNSALLGIGLAMDAFSVSLANGLNDPCMRRRKMYGIAGVFGLFQGIMPFVGWVFVHTLTESFKVFQSFIPWIALGLLSFIGAKMILDGVEEMRTADGEKDVCIPKNISLGAIIIQGIATSIDALSVGFTIAEYSFVEALVASLIIAAITFVICLAGVIAGKKFGTALAGKSGIFGGVILIAIGIEIFVTSLI